MSPPSSDIHEEIEEKEKLQRECSFRKLKLDGPKEKQC